MDNILNAIFIERCSFIRWVLIFKMENIGVSFSPKSRRRSIPNGKGRTRGGGGKGPTEAITFSAWGTVPGYGGANWLSRRL
jgi:hypothetical protein